MQYSATKILADNLYLSFLEAAYRIDAHNHSKWQYKLPGITTKAWVDGAIAHGLSILPYELVLMIKFQNWVLKLTDIAF